MARRRAPAAVLAGVIPVGRGGLYAGHSLQRLIRRTSDVGHEFRDAGVILYNGLAELVKERLVRLG